LPLRRLLLPWASISAPADVVIDRKIPELEGGDWFRGRELFFSQQARCSSCHQVRGRGGNVGADLSNLIHRDYASVLRDIRAPSVAINPDYITHVVTLHDGRILQGALRTEGSQLLIGDAAGKQTAIERADVDTLTPTPLSIMPEGLDRSLGDAALRDLLTFLMTEPLKPATLDRDDAPPPRRRAEVEAVLKGSMPVTEPRKLHVVLAGGPKDHGPGEHDYPLWQERWSALLKLAEGVTVSTADGFPTPQQFEQADTIVFYSNNPGWSVAKAAELDRHLARGRGLAYIHYAVDGHKDVEALRDRIGLAWRGGASRFRHGPLEIDFSGSKHPITRGFEKLSLVDESYWNLVGDPQGVQVLGTGVEQDAPQPLFWTREQGNGRVFVSIPGHFNWTFDDPLFRVLLLRAIAWTAHDEIDRFNELATIGARLSQ
jgi:putative heme-binding domain-containing protein